MRKVVADDYEMDEDNEDIVDVARRLSTQLSKFLNVALESLEEAQVTPVEELSTDPKPQSRSTDNESDNKFPTNDDDFTPNQSLDTPLLVRITRIKDTADIAEELTSECANRRIIREYRLSANDLIRQYETAIVNINCDKCRSQFCVSVKETEAVLQQLFTKCSTNPAAETDLIERFRNSTIESFKILSESESEIRQYDERKSETVESETSEDNSTSELERTMKLLRGFYGAFTYVTGTVTAMLESSPEPEVRKYLKKRTADLSHSTNKMIIYIESYLLYNYLMGKLNNMEKMMEELKRRRGFEMSQLLQIMLTEAKDLTLTFKRIVNHFEMKQSSQTSGELIRSSFSLEKSAKTFAFNVKKTQFILKANYNGKKQLKIDYGKEFIEKARLILNLFLVEINKIVKAAA